MIPQIYFDKVKKYFDGNQRKTWLWFYSANVFFGGLTPMEMIKRGRENKVKLFIDNAIDENKRFYP